jgi:hypothetical protein
MQKLTVVIVVTVNFAIVWDTALCIVTNAQEELLSLSSSLFYSKTVRSFQKPALLYNTKLRYILWDSKLELNYVNPCSTRIMLLHNLKIRAEVSAQCPTVLIDVYGSSDVKLRSQAIWMFQVKCYDHKLPECFRCSVTITGYLNVSDVTLGSQAIWTFQM